MTAPTRHAADGLTSPVAVNETRQGGRVVSLGDGNNPSNNTVTTHGDPVTHSVNGENGTSNNPSNSATLENTPGGGATSVNGGNNPSNTPVTGVGLSFPGPLKGGHDRGNGDRAQGVLQDTPQVVTAWRSCPTCGEAPCRLELTICGDGRPLVGWTCQRCGGLARTRQGGLWAPFAPIAAAGIDMSALPVRIDYRQTDVDPTPLFGDGVGTDWRVASVKPAGVGHGR